MGGVASARRNWRWHKTQDVVGCPCCDGFAYETIPMHFMHQKSIYRCPLGHTFYCWLPPKPTAEELAKFEKNLVSIKVERRVGLMGTRPQALVRLFETETEKAARLLTPPPAPQPKILEWSITGRNYPCPECGERCHEVYYRVKASFPAIYTFRCKNGHKWSESERWEEATWKREWLYREPGQ